MSNPVTSSKKAARILKHRTCRANNPGGRRGPTLRTLVRRLLDALDGTAIACMGEAGQDAINALRRAVRR